MIKGAGNSEAGSKHAKTGIIWQESIKARFHERRFAAERDEPGCVSEADAHFLQVLKIQASFLASFENAAGSGGPDARHPNQLQKICCHKFDRKKPGVAQCPCSLRIEIFIEILALLEKLVWLESVPAEEHICLIQPEFASIGRSGGVGQRRVSSPPGGTRNSIRDGH